MPIDVDTLRRLFRGLNQFGILFQETGVDELTHEGESWSYHDLCYLFEESQRRLPKRQAEAIMFFLVRQMREEDVAVMMGLKPTNPIGMYATTGLERLVFWIEDGQLPRFKAEATHVQDAFRSPSRTGGGGERVASPLSGQRHVA